MSKNKGFLSIACHALDQNSKIAKDGTGKNCIFNGIACFCVSLADNKADKNFLFASAVDIVFQSVVILSLYLATTTSTNN